VTGLDLVKEQIRVAAGEPLSFPDEVSFRGHAIEFRINAEDPERSFAPSPGTVSIFHPPGGPGVRLDTHLYQGYRVPPYYDSLLAKLIVSGNTREEALHRARNALSHMVIEGVHTTVDFLLEVVEDDEFRSGEVDTGYLARFFARRKGGDDA
jgi:acetyl-CoA carboxylase biotin carboxylase subunit